MAPPFVLTNHVRDRYAEHHPEATTEHLIAAIVEGEIIEPALAAALLGRTRVDHQAQYRVSPDQRGIFVLTDTPPRAVTYLRLAEVAQRILRGAPAPATTARGKKVPSPPGPPKRVKGGIEILGLGCAACDLHPSAGVRALPNGVWNEIVNATAPKSGGTVLLAGVEVVLLPVVSGAPGFRVLLPAEVPVLQTVQESRANKRLRHRAEALARYNAALEARYRPKAD